MSTNGDTGICVESFYIRVFIRRLLENYCFVLLANKAAGGSVVCVAVALVPELQEAFVRDFVLYVNDCRRALSSFCFDDCSPFSNMRSFIFSFVCVFGFCDPCMFYATRVWN